MTVDYINNTNQRTPCVLVLGFLFNQPIHPQENKNKTIKRGLESTGRRSESGSNCTYSSSDKHCDCRRANSTAEMLMDWTDANHFSAFNLKEGGNTPLAEGLELGLDLIENAKANLKTNGISYTRPWMFVMSDGEPTSNIKDWSEFPSM